MRMNKNALYDEAFALLKRANELLDAAFANINRRLAAEQKAA
jgi:hypothetical protein